MWKVGQRKCTRVTAICLSVQLGILIIISSTGAQGGKKKEREKEKKQVFCSFLFELISSDNC